MCLIVYCFAVVFVMVGGKKMCTARIKFGVYVVF